MSAKTIRRDPTRTGMIRKGIIAEIRRRLSRLSKEIVKLVVTDDAFGISRKESSVQTTIRSTLDRFKGLTTNQDFMFLQDPEKLEAFKNWIRKQHKSGGLAASEHDGDPWLMQYVESAYKKGKTNAYISAKGYSTEVDPELGVSPEQFLKMSFNAPESKHKIEMLYVRAYDQLDGITLDMDKRMSRILAEGLMHGHAPKKIAKRLVDEVGLTKTRAERIARTEIMYVHAEGQLDMLESMGFDEVGVMAELSTAGDDKVCPRCWALEKGAPFTIAQARGVIPVHPNCRCSWIPWMGTKRQLAGRRRRKIPPYPYATKKTSPKRGGKRKGPKKSTKKSSRRSK